MELEIQKQEDGKYYHKVMIPEWKEMTEEVIKENYYKADSEFDKNLKELTELDEEIEKRQNRNAEIEPALIVLKKIMLEENWASNEETQEDQQ